MTGQHRQPRQPKPDIWDRVICVLTGVAIGAVLITVLELIV